MINDQNSKNIKNNKPKVDLSRRRLAKFGILAAPVLATLPGKPAMALYNKNNCTVSGNLSGNMSDNVDNEDPCKTYNGGLTPGYWGQHPNKWLSCGVQYIAGSCVGDWVGPHCSNNDYNDDGILFHDVTNGFAGFDHIGKTMMQVIQEGGNGDNYQLGAHAVAALLNAEYYATTIYDYGMTPDEVIALYNTYYQSNPEELKLSFQYLNEWGTDPMNPAQPPDPA